MGLCLSRKPNVRYALAALGCQAETGETQKRAPVTMTSCKSCVLTAEQGGRVRLGKVSGKANLVRDRKKEAQSAIHGLEF